MSAVNQWVFATNNAHKIEEAQAILSGKLTLVSLKEAGIDIEVDETGLTFHENAYLKAQAIFEATGLPCVADDSGLCVDVLNGAPGVFSARYAGEPVNHQANNEKLLRVLEGESNRKASFKTVLCVVGHPACEGKPLYFEGAVEGEILASPSGSEGFGYDPVFKPNGFSVSFADMTAQQKNALSHRAKAFESLTRYLELYAMHGPAAHIPPLPVSDYDYDLPADRIAFEALEPRDASKLLMYKGNPHGDGQISESFFSALDQQLEAGDVIVANDTKVIPARLHGTVSGGAVVEVFLLTPLDMEWTQWEVMVGNRRKFKESEVVRVSGNTGFIEIHWLDRDRNRIRMSKSDTFANMQEAIESLGAVPLPPYIEREVTEEDKARYQAIFAQNAGAVAAPTASLHFTEGLRNRISERGISWGYLTLHVGAGTFKPMTSEYANEHEMHAERFAVDLKLLDLLIGAMVDGKRVIAIGTTSMRVLESLYLMGCRLIHGCWEGMVYSGDGYDMGLRLREGKEISMEESLSALREYVVEMGGVIQGQTQVFILERFEFRVVKGLITNFHQPKSTLMMLVSAFVRRDWRRIYTFALGNGYRFLSYGDGSLLWR